MLKLFWLFASDPARTKRIMAIINEIWPKIEELLSLLPKDEAAAQASGALEQKVTLARARVKAEREGRWDPPPDEFGVRPK